MLLIIKEKRLATLLVRWIKFLPHQQILQRNPYTKAKLLCKRSHQSTISMKRLPSQSSWSRTLHQVQWKEKMSCSRPLPTKAPISTLNIIQKDPTGLARKMTATSMATKWTVKTWMPTFSITRCKTPSPKVTIQSMTWIRRQSLEKAQICSTWLTIRLLCCCQIFSRISNSNSQDLSKTSSRKRSAN